VGGGQGITGLVTYLCKNLGSHPHKAQFGAKNFRQFKNYYLL
jgi:hypothetical protein